MANISVTNLDRLKSQLLTSGLQQKNNPLYQVIDQLINALRQTINSTNLILGGSGGSGGLVNQTFLTLNNETASLPHSVQLVAGENITFDDSIPNQLTINATASLDTIQSTQLEIKQAEIDLDTRLKNGKVTINDIFTKDQVGSPVIINQAPDRESDSAFVVFIAEVISIRQMRIFWMAPFGAPRKVKVNYLIGA